MRSRRRGRKLRFVEVERCVNGGYILSIGPMSIWISARSARAIVEALGESSEDLEDGAEEGGRRPGAAVVARRAN